MILSHSKGKARLDTYFFSFTKLLKEIKNISFKLKSKGLKIELYIMYIFLESKFILF